MKHDRRMISSLFILLLDMKIRRMSEASDAQVQISRRIVAPLTISVPATQPALLLQEDVLHELGRSRTKARTSLKLLPQWSLDRKFTLLGAGRTSRVWKATSQAARRLFRAKDWWTGETDTLGPHVALKDIGVKAELVQALSEEDRTRANVKAHLKAWKARCKSIYKPLSKKAESWGIAPYIVRPHACAFMHPVDYESGRAKRKHLPHLVVASDVARGRSLRAHFAHRRAAGDSWERQKQDALSILLQCMSVLSALADHGIYHNDLHGGNVVVDDAGTATSFRVCFPPHVHHAGCVDVRDLPYPACVARVLDFDLASRHAPVNANFSPSHRRGHPPFRDAFHLYAHLCSILAPRHLPETVDRAFRAMVVDAPVDQVGSLAWVQPIEGDAHELRAAWMGFVALP